MQTFLKSHVNSNMRNIIFSVFLLSVCAFLGYNFWKNRDGAFTASGKFPGKEQKGASSENFNNTVIDTMPGYKGSDRAGMYVFPNNERKYVYQHFNIQVVPQPDKVAGEKIFITPSEGGIKWEVPLPISSRFIGVHSQHMMVETDGADGKREVLFVDVKNKRASYQSELVDSPEVYAGKLKYFAPIVESEMYKMPECPKKSEWEGKGKKTMYAQLVMYDFSNGSVTRKSEYMCYGK